MRGPRVLPRESPFVGPLRSPSNATIRPFELKPTGACGCAIQATGAGGTLHAAHRCVTESETGAISSGFPTLHSPQGGLATDQEAEGSNPSGRAITSVCSTTEAAGHQCSGKTIEFVAWESIGNHFDSKPGRRMAMIFDRWTLHARWMLPLGPRVTDRTAAPQMGGLSAEERGLAVGPPSSTPSDRTNTLDDRLTRADVGTFGALSVHCVPCP